MKKYFPNNKIEYIVQKKVSLIEAFLFFIQEKGFFIKNNCKSKEINIF